MISAFWINCSIFSSTVSRVTVALQVTLLTHQNTDGSTNNVKAADHHTVFSRNVYRIALYFHVQSGRDKGIHFQCHLTKIKGWNPSTSFGIDGQ